MKNAKRQAPTLDEIEEYEMFKWLNEQLDRLERLVREHGADEEMLDAISYVRAENDRWATPDVEELDHSGKLQLPSDGGVSH